MYLGRFGRRRALSPVLATVILIAITLVSGVAMAGFSFGLFGSNSASADVSAVSVTCVSGTSATSACQVTMKNIGDASSAITACSLSGAASTVSGTTVVSSGQSSSATCTGAPSGTVPGERVQGSFTFSSGIIITFAGFYE